MKISVVMPTFNSEKFISESLFSIKNQTYENWELIIMDNLSSDKTEAIVKNFGFSDKIKFFKEKDTCIPDALNKGFEKCSGDIFCWLNSDDVYLNKNVFLDIVKIFENKKIDFSVGNFCTMDEKGKINKSLYAWFPENQKMKKYTYFNILTASLFFTKSSYKKFGSFSTNWRNGWEYELTIFLFKNLNGKYINSFLSSYRIHELADSIVDSDGFKLSMKEVFDKHNVDWSMKYNSFERLIFNFKNGILIDFLLNIIVDKYKNNSWKDLFFKI